MKLFLRGLLALGIAAALALTANADTPPATLPSTNPAPAAKAAAPGTAVAGAPAGGCSTCAADGSAHRLLKGRFSRHGVAVAGGSGRFSGAADAAGQKAERLAEGYLGFQERLGAFFERLAGPPVEPVAGGNGFGKGGKGGSNTQPGTVVFPQHPFVRSPRDYFMTEQP